MATDDLDPVKSAQRANDQLRVALLALDEHIVALTAPTMELALIQKKRASEVAGLEEREPSDLIKKFVSQAGPGAKIGPAEPGQLGPDASEPWAPGTRDVRETMGQPGVPHEQAGKVGYGQPIGPAEAKEFGLDQEPIPWEGRFQLDAILKMARAHYSRKASEEYESGELQPGETSANASMAGTLNWASSLAPKVVAAKQVMGRYVGGPLRDALDMGVGAAHMGASLGYTPQGEGLLGASHLLGLPNPLSVIGPWASPGARQGTGSFVNAAESAFGGTGISFSEANKLREGLAAQGWSNQRAGGFLGATIGGQQENIAKALEPLVKAGFNPEQLASTTNALKLGQATPEELKKTLEQLPEIAKTLHKTLEEVTANMEEFAAKTVENGSTIIHGMQTYGGIAKMTGLNPLLTQTANEGTFGTVAAAQKGVLPWQVASMGPGQAATNALQAVKLLSSAAGTSTAVKTKNEYGETREISAEAAHLAMMHQIEPDMTTEYMKRMLELGKRLPGAHATELGAIESGEEKIKGAQAIISHQRHENEAWGPNVKTARTNETAWHQAEAQLKQYEAELKKGGGNIGPLEEERLERLKATSEEKYHATKGAMKKAEGEGKLTSAQQNEIRNELPALYQRAREAGLGHSGEIKQWMMEAGQNPEKVLTNINAALAKKAEVEPEKNENTKAEIVMNSSVEKWFHLRFPKAKSPKEEAGAGGKSTASQAAQPSTGEPGETQANRKLAEQARRQESTVGS